MYGDKNDTHYEEALGARAGGFLIASSYLGDAMRSFGARKYERGAYWPPLGRRRSHSPAWLDGFLQFLAGAEGDLLARLDLHRFLASRFFT